MSARKNSTHAAGTKAAAPRAPRTKTPVSIENAATLDFEAMGPDVAAALMSRADFLSAANTAYNVILIGVSALSKSPADLVAAFRSVEAGDSEGDAITGFLSELGKTKDWFSGYANTLECIEARSLVAAARLAMELGA